MATIFDVARAAGVSTGTVSRALNQHPEVSEVTRERVLAAAARLGYSPDPLARGLVTRATATVGLVIPDIASPFFHELARGVEDVARANGQLVVLCNTDRSLEKERQYLAALRAHRIGGLILAGAHAGLPPQGLPALPSTDGPRENRIPTVLVIRRDRTDVPALLLDYRAAVREVIAYLAGLGHSRIGYVNGPAAQDNSSDRLAGYRAALEAAGLPFDRDLVTAAEFTIEGGHAAASRLLALTNSPTALALANDYMALGAVQAARARGLAVPADLSVVGFNDFVTASLVEPPLTTVRVPIREMGARAMSLLLEEIERRRSKAPAEAPRIEYVPTQLVVRQSAAPLIA